MKVRICCALRPFQLIGGPKLFGIFDGRICWCVAQGPLWILRDDLLLPPMNYLGVCGRKIVTVFMGWFVLSMTALHVRVFCIPL